MTSIIVLVCLNTKSPRPYFPSPILPILIYINSAFISTSLQLSFEYRKKSLTSLQNPSLYTSLSFFSLSLPLFLFFLANTLTHYIFSLTFSLSLPFSPIHSLSPLHLSRSLSISLSTSKCLLHLRITVGSKVGTIGHGWDKYGTFSDQYQYILFGD